jgi:hypothetical protein
MREEREYRDCTCRILSCLSHVLSCALGGEPDFAFLRDLRALCGEK